MSVVLDIFRTYRKPSAVFERRLSGPPREDRALAVLMGACFLIFIAQWPRLSREAFLDDSIPLDARMGGALFGWVMVMPLVFYVLSLLIQGALAVFGARAPGAKVRMAVFWALLASTPLWLLAGLMAGLADQTAATLTGSAALGAFIIFAGLGLVAAARIGQEAFT